MARGGIYRDVTVNLIALRAIGGPTDQSLRNYILGLALVAANDPSEEFLRQGCLLTLHPEAQAHWVAVERSGARQPIAFGTDDPFKFAKDAAMKFGVAPPRTYDFVKERARQLVDEQKAGKKKATQKGKAKEQNSQEGDQRDSED